MSTQKLLIINQHSPMWKKFSTSFNSFGNWEIITADSLSSLMFQIIINQPKLIVLVDRITELKEVEVVRVIRKSLGYLSPVILLTTKKFTVGEQNNLTEFRKVQVISNLNDFTELITNMDLTPTLRTNNCHK
ncbi:hypothetical protein [Floridanema aerugineum]|uniref:Uncharacterized protein n=1 Tax=Floridaenema aerugineum BLCC-F46 TaxID=3153654 RepID=A0ABV4X2V4_9CYAN